MENIILIGFGGHAKSVADTIERTGMYSIIGYTDIEDRNSKYKYLGPDDVLETFNKSVCNKLALGIGYLGKGRVRENIYSHMTGLGYEFPPIVDPDAIVSANALVGPAAFVGKGAIINAEAQIGTACIINSGAIVEHECTVSDYTHISVGTILCGQVTVGRGAFVGAGAVVIQCRSVDEYSTVPAGAVIK